MKVKRCVGCDFPMGSRQTKFVNFHDACLPGALVGPNEVPRTKIYSTATQPLPYLKRVSLIKKYAPRGTRCVYCNRELTRSIATREHLHPRSKGGKDIASNLAWACNRCNGAKGSMTVNEFKQFIRQVHDHYLGDKNGDSKNG